jgi:hypothetical protein
LDFRVWMRAASSLLRKGTGPGPFDEVTKGIAGAGEGQILPWDLFRSEDAYLQGLVSGFRVSSEHLHLIDNDDDGTIGVRVDIKETPHRHMDVDLLPRLPHHGLFYGLSPVHESSGKDPLAIGGFDASPAEEDLSVDPDDGPHGHFGVKIEDKRAAFADEPCGFSLL